MKITALITILSFLTGCANNQIHLTSGALNDVNNIALISGKPPEDYTVVPHVSSGAAFAVGFLTGGIGVLIFTGSYIAVIKTASSSFTKKITDERPDMAKVTIDHLLNQIAKTPLLVEVIKMNDDSQVISADTFNELNIEQDALLYISIQELGYSDGGGKGYRPYTLAKVLLFKKNQLEPIYRKNFISNNTSSKLFSPINESEKIYGEYTYHSIDALEKDANNAQKNLLEILKQLGKQIADDLLTAKGDEIQQIKQSSEITPIEKENQSEEVHDIAEQVIIPALAP